jgi:mono/diheme cytochrome c family protein
MHVSYKSLHTLILFGFLLTFVAAGWLGCAPAAPVGGYADKVSLAAFKAGGAWAPPSGESARLNPVPFDNNSIRAGRLVYIHECRDCHGRQGRGDGNQATELAVRPTDLLDRRVLGQADGALFWKITSGHGEMPGYGKMLTAEERWQVIHYVRSLGGAAAQTPTRAAPTPAAPATAPNARAAAGVSATSEQNRGAAASPGTGQQASARLALPFQTASAEEIVSPAPASRRAPEMPPAPPQAAPQGPFSPSTFLLTGYAAARFVDPKHDARTGDATLAPILLWRPTERLLFETEVEIEFEREGDDTATHANLEFASLSYLVNDYIVIGGGKFLTPFGQFPERLHPAWINKLPDFPMVFDEEDGLVPFSTIGGFVRGGFPASFARFNYAFYLGSAPRVNNSDEESVGIARDNNRIDIGENKVIGGRVGVMPLAGGLEVGYSFQWGHVNGPGTRDATILMQAADISYTRHMAPIGGVIDFRMEYVWSDIGNMTFDPTGSADFGPLRRSVSRNGGYVQLTYRPTDLRDRIDFLSQIEFIARYDVLNAPNSVPGEGNQKRWTFGVDYWLTESIVLKAAYEFGDSHDDADPQAFVLQIAIGF